jgi:hypothetical protein
MGAVCFCQDNQWSEGRRNSIFDACRALLAQGITARLEVSRRGRTSADMQLTIERGALLAIREMTTLSPPPVPWHPFWHTDHVDPNAVLYGGVQPLADVCDPPVADTRQPKRPPVTPPRTRRALPTFSPQPPMIDPNRAPGLS